MAIFHLVTPKKYNFLLCSSFFAHNLFKVDSSGTKGYIFGILVPRRIQKYISQSQTEFPPKVLLKFDFNLILIDVAETHKFVRI